MIRIRKPAVAPPILRERGAALTAELCSKIAAGEPISFDHDVYGAPTVKRALCTAQHDKCCFCESKLSHAQFGDVEHFRPKGRAQQADDAPFSPGYYWLAYDWSNLYLSCAVCNQRHKRGLFPLANPDQRVSSHHRAAELGTEQPLFVDPGTDDPETMIEFRREYPAAVDANARGKVTIQELGLDRPALCQHRREHRQPYLAALKLLVAALRRGIPEDDSAVTEALDHLVNATTDGAAYSSMMRELLRRLIPEQAARSLSAATLLEALRVEAARDRPFDVDAL
jgi:uncharacterized protein (TIGR02646 family)